VRFIEDPPVSPKRSITEVDGPVEEQNEAKKPKTDAPRKSNWELDDTHAFLVLLSRHQMDFAQVLLSLQNDQHRRTNDTEVSLGKYWKNLKGSQSKFQKPFAYPKFRPGKLAPGKHTRAEAKKIKFTQEVVWAEERSKAEKVFGACVKLISDLQEKEVLLRSGEEVPTDYIESEKRKRENIRALRLLRSEEMARRDEVFQVAATDAMQQMVAGQVQNQANITSLVDLMARFVTMEERKSGL